MPRSAEPVAAAVAIERRLVHTSYGILGVIVVGAGPDLVLLHGVTDNATTWLPVQRRLADRARLHAIDLPGHGTSFIPSRPMTMAAMADVAIAYLDASGISTCVLVGNSLGAGVALGVCARAPARVSAALLLGTVGAPFRLHAALRLLRRDWAAERMASIADVPRLRYWILRRGFPSRYHPTQEMVANYWDGWRGPGRPGYMGALIRGQDVAEPLAWLPRITQRVHILHGTRDRFVPQRVSHRVATTLPNATLTLLPGVGHQPQHDATDAVCAAACSLAGVHG